jgi:hypothetical protein
MFWNVFGIMKKIGTPFFGGSIAAETVEKPFSIVNGWFSGVS